MNFGTHVTHKREDPGIYLIFFTYPSYYRCRCKSQWCFMSDRYPKRPKLIRSIQILQKFAFNIPSQGMGKDVDTPGPTWALVMGNPGNISPTARGYLWVSYPQESQGCTPINTMVLLMAEILHHLGCMKPYK